MLGEDGLVRRELSFDSLGRGSRNIELVRLFQAETAEKGVGGVPVPIR